MLTITAPYLYQWCPECDLPIRFTLKVLPDGQLEYEDGIVTRALAIHYRLSCEARPR